jgi:hypothetical protein
MSTDLTGAVSPVPSIPTPKALRDIAQGCHGAATLG